MSFRENVMLEEMIKRWTAFCEYEHKDEEDKSLCLYAADCGDYGCTNKVVFRHEEDDFFSLTIEDRDGVRTTFFMKVEVQAISSDPPSKEP